MASPAPTPVPKGATGALVFADGRVVWGQGFGAEGAEVAELCFHTAMTGYQEVMTDPSFAKQAICFTFPHIGNVGANNVDLRGLTPVRTLVLLDRMRLPAVNQPGSTIAGRAFQSSMAAAGDSATSPQTAIPARTGRTP